jgi:hypothetical protein
VWGSLAHFVRKTETQTLAPIAGVTKKKPVFNCWKNTRHGGHITKFIAIILRCTNKEAQLVYEGEKEAFDTSSFDSLSKNVDTMWDDIANPVEKKLRLKLPDEFLPMDHKGYNKHFVRYLLDRGFSDLGYLYKAYGIGYANTGFYKDRIIFPIRINKKLVTYTGRAITPASIKYRSLSAVDSLAVIKDTVWNFDNLIKYKGKILYLCEGPFDSLKVDYYGKRYRSRATCLFGKTLSDKQTTLVYQLSKNYDRVVILLDPEEEYGTRVLKQQLEFIKNVEVGCLPNGVGDPGELTSSQIKGLT